MGLLKFTDRKLFVIISYFIPLFILLQNIEAKVVTPTDVKYFFRMPTFGPSEPMANNKAGEQLDMPNGLPQAQPISSLNETQSAANNQIAAPLTNTQQKPSFAGASPNHNQPALNVNATMNDTDSSAKSSLGNEGSVKTAAVVDEPNGAKLNNGNNTTVPLNVEAGKNHFANEIPPKIVTGDASIKPAENLKRKENVNTAPKPDESESDIKEKDKNKETASSSDQKNKLRVDSANAAHPKGIPSDERKTQTNGAQLEQNGNPTANNLEELKENKNMDNRPDNGKEKKIEAEEKNVLNEVKKVEKEVKKEEAKLPNGIIKSEGLLIDGIEKVVNESQRETNGFDKDKDKVDNKLESMEELKKKYDQVIQELKSLKEIVSNNGNSKKAEQIIEKEEKLLNKEGNILENKKEMIAEQEASTRGEQVQQEQKKDIHGQSETNSDNSAQNQPPEMPPTADGQQEVVVQSPVNPTESQVEDKSKGAELWDRKGKQQEGQSTSKRVENKKENEINQQVEAVQKEEAAVKKEEGNAGISKQNGMDTEKPTNGKPSNGITTLSSKAVQETTKNTPQKEAMPSTSVDKPQEKASAANAKKDGQNEGDKKDKTTVNKNGETNENQDKKKTVMNQNGKGDSGAKTTGKDNGSGNQKVPAAKKGATRKPAKNGNGNKNKNTNKRRKLSNNSHGNYNGDIEESSSESDSDENDVPSGNGKALAGAVVKEKRKRRRVF